MGMGKRFTDIQLAKVASLEHKLSSALKPVTPRQEFINRLGEHIQTNQRSTLVNNVANWHIIALMVASFATLAFGLAMIARALLGNVQKKRPV
jgi:hypothetical protein